MKVLLQIPFGNPQKWAEALQQKLQQEIQQIRLQIWHENNSQQAQADYGVVWKPPAILFSQQQQLKAIFSLGAGVDHILSLGSALPKHVPIIRLEDDGKTNG